MVFDAIVGVLLAVFNGVLGLFPAYSLPDSITSFGSSVGSSVGSVNGVFPITTLGICIGIMLAARLFVAVFGLVAWIYDKIPFKAT